MDKKNIRLTVQLNRVYFQADPKEEGGSFWAAVNFAYVHKGDCAPLLPDKLNSGYITVTGNYYEIPHYGQSIDIIVERLDEAHPKYGIQYKLKRIVTEVDFSNAASVKTFLLTVITQKQYEALVEADVNIGEALKEENVSELCKAKGIKETTANKIIRRFKEKEARASIIEALEGIAIPPSVITKLESIVTSDEALIDIIKNHPYMLIEMVNGVGFKTADKIALSRGMDEGNVERIEAFVKYYLFKLGEEGQSYISAAELTNIIFSELGSRKEIYREIKDKDGNVIDNNISLALSNLQERKEVVVEDSESKSERRVYLTYYRDLEAKISNEIKRLLSYTPEFKEGIEEEWDKAITLQEEQQQWEYTDEQREGIKTALKNNLVLITGSAGSGKSSVVSGILTCLENKTIAQCALAGKAAARLQEATGRPASTIHRLLEFKGTQFARSRNYPLDQDVIVVDELSMINGELFYSLIQAIGNGKRMILLGDMAQLESIGSLNIISDLFNSSIIPKVTLTKIHRQAQDSGILSSSLKVRDKKPIFEKNFNGKKSIGVKKDMEMQITSTNEGLLERVIETFKKEFESSIVGRDINKIQIITPLKKRGGVSAEKINNEIQELYNPLRPGETELLVSEYTDAAEDGTPIKSSICFRPRDKVICIKNFYGIEKFVEEKNQLATYAKDDIFNGWVGTFEGMEKTFICTNEDETQKIRVTSSYLKENRFTLELTFPQIRGPYEVGVFTFPFIEGKVMIPKAEIGEYFSLGYASTVHKMQGSEYPVVIGAIDGYLPPFMGTKELLYTLITRAKDRLVLIGRSATISRCISTSFVSNKKTFLLEFLNKEEKVEPLKFIE